MVSRPRGTETGEENQRKEPSTRGSGGSQWMGRPTFLTKEELEAKRSPVSKNPEPDPDPETRTTTDPWERPESRKEWRNLI